MKDKRQSIPRLEYEALVQSCFEQLKDRQKTIDFIRVKAQEQGRLSSPRTYEWVMIDTKQFLEICKWHPKLKNMVAKSVIIKVARHNNIELPRMYKLSQMQLDLIEELPKEKPLGINLGAAVHSADVEIAPPKLSDHTHGISLGHLTDSAKEFSRQFMCEPRRLFTPKELEDAQMKAEHPLERHIQKAIKHMMNYRASPEQIRNQLDAELKQLVLDKSPNKFPDTAAGHAKLRHRADDIFHEMLFGTPAKAMAAATSIPVKRMFGTDLASMNLSELEARIYATTYPNLKFDLDTAEELAKSLTAPEKPMRNFKVTRPVLVGNVDILTASDDTLVSIIRDAKNEQENMKDMVEVSAKFKAKSKELDDVIALCVEQLDKEEKK